jgi:hypothetical protein
LTLGVQGAGLHEDAQTLGVLLPGEDGAKRRPQPGVRRRSRRLDGVKEFLTRSLVRVVRKRRWECAYPDAPAPDATGRPLERTVRRSRQVRMAADQRNVIRGGRLEMLTEGMLAACLDPTALPTSAALGYWSSP